MSVVELSAVDLRVALRNRELSSRELTSACLDQINRLDAVVNAVPTRVAESALASARAADERLARGDEVGELHGIPMVHKDTHNTAGIRTTYGSPIYRQHVPEVDDLVIERLRAAGAISLGKSNTPEFAIGSHTVNPVFGRTANPYDLSKSAGGSSGGAAAALASRMIPLADGSDTGGSLRNPASFCNVVGLRPTPGLVPNFPDLFNQFTMATSGPMARSVDDVALLLFAMAGRDHRVAPSLPSDPRTFLNVPRVEAERLRVAISPTFGGLMPIEPEVVEIVTNVGNVLTDIGVDVVETLPDFGHANFVFRTRRAMQFVSKFGDLVRDRPDEVSAAIRWNVAVGHELSADDVGQAIAEGGRIYAGMDAFFERFDAFVVPTVQVLPFDGALEYPTAIAGREMSDYLEWMRSCSDVTVTGCPAISVPAGFTAAGLPVGVQFVARSGCDVQLLSIARMFEDVTRHATRQPEICTAAVRPSG